jgi:hypothetical protein
VFVALVVMVLSSAYMFSMVLLWLEVVVEVVLGERMKASCTPSDPRVTTSPRFDGDDDDDDDGVE